MIIVTCVYKKNMVEHSFTTLTEALVFARSQDVGVSYQIREGTTVLAKGRIENLREDSNY